ncbi:MAG: PssD/Cps14F family polysaccharide biosynthesis glycosyltransferase [Candidatus Zhuqueibacterota bacterium]
MASSELKICITFSSGGHYREARLASRLLEGDMYYVTFRTPHLEKESETKRFYFIEHPGRNLFRLIKNAVQAFRIIRKEKPDVILSTGADVAVPTCIIGKLFGAKLVYIESGGQVYTPSLSGRLVHRFADLFLVQWEPALKNFPNAVYGGPLF